MATSLQLFNKVDLQAVMKAGRWSSGGTFTSFYLRGLCPQADKLRKTGSVIAAGEIGGDLLGELNYVYFVSSASYIPLSLVLNSRLRIGEVFFICWKSNYGCPRASPSRRPPLSVKFWYNQNYYNINYLNYLQQN